MDREVRYCTTDDGVRIAYAKFGKGQPLLFIIPWTASLERETELAETRAWYEALLKDHTVVRFDIRGTGASDRGVPLNTPARTARDALNLMDHLELEQTDIFAGPGIAAHVGVLLAAQHPRRCRRLVLWEPFARVAHQDDQAIAAMQLLIRQNWRGATRVMADMLAPSASTDVKKMLTFTIREGIDANALADTMLEKSDVSELLPQVRQPVLVLHPRQNKEYPLETARDVAATVPDGRVVVVEGDTSYFYLLHEQLIPHLVRFLRDAEADPPAEHPSPFRTVLFTDIVGHTEMMQRLGDTKGRDVLREHERITRETLNAHGGAEVKTMGDGFLASFGSVTAAMECAIALQRAFASHTAAMPEPLHVRVGLNAGEPIEEDGDLFGATVILASRIVAKAGAGEILVPDTVRGLLSGKGFVFGDRGEFIPKGFDEGVRLWDVRWRE